MKVISVIGIAGLLCGSVFGGSWEVQSQDKQVKIRIQNEPVLAYSVQYDGMEILKNSAISLLTADDTAIGSNLDILKTDQKSGDSIWTPVNWYYKIIKAAAENYLMVDFHGAYKPDGLRHTWPNYMTQEGVLGNKYNKWSDRMTPDHKVTLPFTRMLTGPMDFTPGGFLKSIKESFKTGVPARVQGTRASELALVVIYDSPVVCICDHPDHYRNQPGADLLKIVPTILDNTKVIDGQIGDYIIMARQSGNRWFVGAITDWTPRTVTIPLRFLPKGKYKVQIWKDAADSNVNAEHLDKESKTVQAKDELKIQLAPGGGCAIEVETGQ